MTLDQLALLASILEHVVEVNGAHIDTLRAAFPALTDEMMLGCIGSNLLTYSESKIVDAAPAGRTMLRRYWTATGRDAETGMALDIAR